MTVLQDGTVAPRNQWYVAAWSNEIGREPIERWVMGEPVALYRKQDGEAVAIGGRCPHRHFPLGKSGVVGDDIECGYHGIRFGPDGVATHVPSQAVVPSVCRVPAYPLAERWQWLWIWMGDPAMADEALIPNHDLIGLTDPDFDSVGGVYFAVPGRYMLMHDNLFDLTHLSFLHRGSIGAGNVGDAKELRDQGETWISSRREMTDQPCPPFFDSVFSYRGKVDRSFGMTLHLPCLHAGYDRFRRARSDDSAPGEHLGEIRVFHAVTPATTTTAHYFFGMSRDFARNDEEYGQALLSGLLPTLEEDMVATREIERMIQQLGGMPREILLRSDETCVRGRRLFETMVQRQEQIAA